jgi:asparagine synthase (glutamine-hydrolysing)
MLVFSAHVGGKTMLTGGGGDEVFSRWTGRAVPKLSLLKLRPRRRALKWFAFMSLPHRLQVAYTQRTTTVATPWLRPEADRDLQRRRRAAVLERSDTWGEVLEYLLGSRYLELVRATLDTFAADNGVRLFEPFYDPRFVRAMIRAAPSDGYYTRTEALETHFDDLLPAEVLQRGTKAVFTEVAWGPGARRFAAEWDGRGLDESLVDPERLRAEWAKPRPDSRSLSCLHQAWLASQPPA